MRHVGGALLWCLLWAGCSSEPAAPADQAVADDLAMGELDAGVDLGATNDAASGPDLRPVACTQCATPVCELAASDGGVTTTCPGLAEDQDHDGLSDAWEQQGYIDVNCNGVNDGEGIDVQLPGAHVGAPDLYLEIDYLTMAGAGTACAIDDDCAAVAGEQCVGNVCTHTHQPKQSSLDAVTAALQHTLPAAPPGVYLHIDTAHMSAIPEAGRGVISFGTNPASPTDRALDANCVGPANNAADFYDVKDAYFYSGAGPSSAFAQARRRVYHYAIFGHYSSCPPGPAGTPEQYCSVCPADRGGNPPKSGATGTSETPGNDVLVSLGAFLFDTGLPLTVNTEGGTFLHELGHNLGLRHGVGVDGAGHHVPANSPNRSPNYLSVMNYNYQTLGVPVASAPGGGTASTFKVDFSDIDTCADLDEDALDETAGAACGATSKYVLYWAPGNFAGAATGGFNHHASTTTGTAIDWNNDASLQSSVAVDLNNDSAHQVHRSMNDWTVMQLDVECAPWTVLDGLSPAQEDVAMRKARASRSARLTSETRQ
jgi:hypothetical protein